MGDPTCTMPVQPVMRLFVRKLSRRSALSADEERAICSLRADFHQLPAGFEFVQLDQRLNHACLVIDGLVARFEQTGRGDRQITALYIPGDMADLHSVVIPKSSWALQTTTASMIVRIPHGDLKSLADRYPNVARAFWRECAIDAAVIAEWAVGIGRRSARERLAHLICELKLRYEEIRCVEGGEFAWSLNQTAVGDILGLTPIHVNRMLRRLKEEGLVEISGRRARVTDWAGLTRAADFDGGYLHFEDDQLVAA